MFNRCYVSKRCGAALTVLVLACPQAWAFEAKGDLTPQPYTATPPSNSAASSPTQTPTLSPDADYRTVYAAAEELRRAGKNKEAADLYLKVTTMEPTFWVAYHQLANLDQKEQIDAAIKHLDEMKAKQPKELLLRVALSELLEKRSDYYQASRELVDLVYGNAVPEKYAKKINARIHYLLSKSKHAYTNEQGGEFENLRAEEELDTVPPPLPDPGLVVRDLASTKEKDIPTMQGAGHTQLLP